MSIQPQINSEEEKLTPTVPEAHGWTAQLIKLALTPFQLFATIQAMRHEDPKQPAGPTTIQGANRAHDPFGGGAESSWSVKSE